jgi:hypothetical protein
MNALDYSIDCWLDAMTSARKVQINYEFQYFRSNLRRAAAIKEGIEALHHDDPKF